MITKINDCKIKHQPNIVLTYFVKALIYMVIELLIYLLQLGRMTCRLLQFFLKKNNQTTRRLSRRTKRRLICPDSDHCGSQKIKA
jgi:hypothetical protein